MSAGDGEDERSDEAWGGLRRLLVGLFPTASGEPPPALRAGRAQLAWVVATVVGLLLGSAAAFLVVLLLQAAPSVPVILVGFAVGAMFGGAAALVFASRYPSVRKWGALAILLFPVVVLLGPFLLLGGAVALLRGRRGGSPARSTAVEVVESRPVPPARRSPRKKPPQKERG